MRANSSSFMAMNTSEEEQYAHDEKVDEGEEIGPILTEN